MRQIARIAAAAALAIGLCLVPILQVAACDCAVRELPESIADAEVAIIGTLAGAGAAPNPGMVAEPIEYVWAVERARDPMSAGTISISAWPDDGANCGISFAPDERWLVLAHQSEGRLETNGCMGNLLLDTAGSDILGVVDSVVAIPIEPSAVAERGASPPAPILVAAGALAVIAAISVLAFRRSGSGTAA